jgi:hypothetical protein
MGADGNPATKMSDDQIHLGIGFSHFISVFSAHGLAVQNMAETLPVNLGKAGDPGDIGHFIG